MRGSLFYSRPQKSFTLSSTEAEYLAMADGFKEAKNLRYLWSFVVPERDVGCTVVWDANNVGAIHLVTNPVTTPNPKTIDIRHHFLRQRAAKSEFKVLNIASMLQQSNFLTKPLHKEESYVHRNFVLS